MSVSKNWTMITVVLVLVVQKKCLSKKSFQNKFEYKLLLLKYMEKNNELKFFSLFHKNC